MSAPSAASFVKPLPSLLRNVSCCRLRSGCSQLPRNATADQPALPQLQLAPLRQRHFWQAPDQSWQAPSWLLSRPQRSAAGPARGQRTACACAAQAAAPSPPCAAAPWPRPGCRWQSRAAAWGPPGGVLGAAGCCRRGCGRCLWAARRAGVQGWRLPCTVHLRQETLAGGVAAGAHAGPAQGAVCCRRGTALQGARCAIATCRGLPQARAWGFEHDRWCPRRAGPSSRCLPDLIRNACLPSSAWSRSWSSSAAFLVKVMHSIELGATSRSVTSCATRCVSTRVLPLPGPAITLQR